MSRFDKYFLMSEKDVIEYVHEKTSFFNKYSKVSCSEIGDGYLNYVFRVMDEITGTSIIIKQCTMKGRIGRNINLSIKRMRIECEILEIDMKIAKGLVPEIYFYDSIMGVCCMEDLYGYSKLTDVLMEHKMLPRFAEHISRYFSDALFMTTDVCLDHKVKKEAVRNFINPELCELREEGVLTESFMGLRQSSMLTKENIEFVNEEVYRDENLLLEIGKFKFNFMNNAQALIHGDLHSGSIFVTNESTKVIDAEFAFYGPIGFDIGSVLGTLYITWISAFYDMEYGYERNTYLKWIEDTITKIIDLFIERCYKKFDIPTIDEMARVPGFKEWYVEGIIKDTAVAMGITIIWNIITDIRGREMNEIKNHIELVEAERRCILDGKNYIINSNSFKCGNDFIKIFK